MRDLADEERPELAMGASCGYCEKQKELNGRQPWYSSTHFWYRCLLSASAEASQPALQISQIHGSLRVICTAQLSVPFPLLHQPPYLSRVPTPTSSQTNNLLTRDCKTRLCKASGPVNTLDNLRKPCRCLMVRLAVKRIRGRSRVDLSERLGHRLSTKRIPRVPTLWSLLMPAFEVEVFSCQPPLGARQLNHRFHVSARCLIVLQLQVSPKPSSG
ncbi:hypothetical protein K491DRAFT_187385 [Lophiostoma macrostomum CBS 122681]|uniref:Uncharacterized protein n=1 Tax=Lophiostoma macrostomum CBS 122681 TaxID=1314788 RepID=A0A6A6TTK2_9PLEO|nr:hypothetical protein K491DRAFT_187385 [Lophiostoma macrostomum CBS 122681]